MMRTDLAAVAVLFLFAAAPVLASGEGAAEANPFPIPAELEPAVHFWTRVYSEVGTDGGLIHDSRDLSIVYEATLLPRGKTSRQRERYVESRKKPIKQILRTLAGGKRSGLSQEQARVLELFPADVSNRTLRAAASHIRFQLGQADKFRAGLIRSGAYVDHIRETLSDMGLPLEIAALPHVESSYNPKAYSRVGAAGLWQFTRSTGRRFMRVDHVVDERLDPYTSAIAAARLLEQNLRVTGAWPLAITAYNHGASGMRRASRKLGTKNIATIVRDYRSRTFGFASRNFYVEFLAASKIADSPHEYFGDFVPDPPVDYATIEIPFYSKPSSLSRAFGVSVATLKEANPALRPAVWQGQKRVPRDFTIKIPRDELAISPATALAGIPNDERYSKQTRDLYHVVRRGEALSKIAARYGVRMRELQELNGLRSRHLIRAGQKLRLPSDHLPAQKVSLRRSEPIRPAVPPPDGLYTVRRGDTLSKIATRFGMSEANLIAANRLRNRNRIYIGQVMHVSTAVDRAVVWKKAPGAEPQPTPDSHPQAIALLTAARSAEPTPIPVQPPVPLNEATASEAGVEIVAVAADINVADAHGIEAIESQDLGVLKADPSDYAVASDGTIEVQTDETLGHYADWLGVRASRLRTINKLPYGEPVVVHGHLRLDFSVVSPEQFERTRIAYHRAMQEEFFSRWAISGTEEHRMRRGDSLWILSHRKFNVPLWLLYQYNPDLDFDSLSAGTKITVPLLEQREWESDPQGALPDSTQAS